MCMKPCTTRSAGADSPRPGTTYQVIEGGELVPICTFEPIGTLDN